MFRQRAPWWRISRDLPAGLLATLLIAGTLGLFVAHWLERSLQSPTSWDWWDPEKAFREAQLAKLRSLGEEGAAIEFQIGDRNFLVADPHAVREFLGLLTSGQEVHRHHSHPERKFTFSFPGRPEIYILGEDSQRPQEYWLQARRTSSSGPYEQTIVLFRSERLRSWLEQNQVAGAR